MMKNEQRLTSSKGHSTMFSHTGFSLLYYYIHIYVHIYTYIQFKACAGWHVEIIFIETFF